MSRSEGIDGIRTARSVTLGLEGFAWKTLDEEATREGLTIDELVTFSVLYYLADVDSGRIARRISRGPYAHPRDPWADGEADHRCADALSGEEC